MKNIFFLVDYRNDVEEVILLVDHIQSPVKQLAKTDNWQDKNDQTFSMNNFGDTSRKLCSELTGSSRMASN